MKWLILSSVIAVCLASERTPPEMFHRSEYPDPTKPGEKETKACGRGKMSWVCDPNGLLTPTEGIVVVNIPSH